MDDQPVALNYLRIKYGPNFLEKIDSKEKVTFVTELLSQEFALYIPIPSKYEIDTKSKRIYLYYAYTTIVVDIPRRAIYLNILRHESPTPLLDEPATEE